jgi:hypothetical protein
MFLDHKVKRGLYERSTVACLAWHVTVFREANEGMEGASRGGAAAAENNSQTQSAAAALGEGSGS